MFRHYKTNGTSFAGVNGQVIVDKMVSAIDQHAFDIDDDNGRAARDKAIAFISRHSS